MPSSVFLLEKIMDAGILGTWSQSAVDGNQRRDNTKPMPNTPSPNLPLPLRTGSQRGHAWWIVLACVAVVLPWLNPWSSGPNPNTLPWLASMAAALAGVAAYRVWADQATGEQWRAGPNCVLSALLCAALLSSAVGLTQYFGVSASLAPWVNYGRAGEAYGNLRQRNQFASLTAIGLTCVVYLAAQGPAFSSQRLLRALLLWGAIGLLAMANGASGSRTGALQWLMVAALAGLWSSKNRRSGLVMACGALLAYGAAVVLMPTLLHASTGVGSPGLLGRIEEPSGCQSRTVLWANVLELIAQKPLFGWGWGELKFAHFTHHYAGERFCALLDNAHNLPLHLAVELGVPVAAALCLALGWAVWRGKPWRETDAARQSAWAILAIIGLHSLVEYPLWYGPFQMAVGLSVWLLWRPHQADRVGARNRTSTGSALPSVVLALGMAAVAYVAWDYTRISQLYRAPAQRLEMFRTDTMAKARASVLFVREVQFAELTTTRLDNATAPRLLALAQRLLHFSPEPTVLKILLDSADVMGLEDDSLRHDQAQFSQAYPQEYARWQARRATVQRLRGEGTP
jgi:O-antigen ligase